MNRSMSKRAVRKLSSRLSRRNSRNRKSIIKQLSRRPSMALTTSRESVKARRVVATAFADQSLNFDLSKYKISHYSKHFKNPRVEKMYRRTHLKRSLAFSRVGFTLFGISMFITAGVDLFAGLDPDDSDAIIIIAIFRALIVIICAASLRYLKGANGESIEDKTQIVYSTVPSIWLVCNVLTVLMYALASWKGTKKGIYSFVNSEHPYSQSCFVTNTTTTLPDPRCIFHYHFFAGRWARPNSILLFTLMISSSGMDTIRAIYVAFWHIILSLIGALVLHLFQHEGRPIEQLLIPESSFLFAALVICVAGNLQIEKTDRTHYQSELQKKYDTKRKNELINAMLPAELAKKMKNNEKEIINMHKSVSILFCAICDFKSLCEHLSEMELVKLVHLVFSTFDDLIASQKVYKVEAIDNVYMCTANCPKADPNHVIHMTSMALRMQAKIEAKLFHVGDDKDIKVKIKIGLHTGDVVGAVVGKKSWSYHLFGDAVNTTSRMCSTAPTSEIQMSQPFKLAFDDVADIFANNIGIDIDIIDRGVIKVKGKGNMQTFILKKKTKEVIGVVPQRTSIGMQRSNDVENIIALDQYDQEFSVKALNYIKRRKFSLAFYATIDEYSTEEQKQSHQSIAHLKSINSPITKNRSTNQKVFKLRRPSANIPIKDERSKSRKSLPVVVPVLPKTENGTEPVFPQLSSNSVASMGSIRRSTSSFLKNVGKTIGKFTEHFSADEAISELDEEMGMVSGRTHSSERIDTRRYDNTATNLTPKRMANQLEVSFRTEFNNFNLEFSQNLALAATLVITSGNIILIYIMHNNSKPDGDSYLTKPILIVLILSILFSILFAIFTRVLEEVFRKRMQTILVFTAISITALYELYLVLARINGYGFNALEPHMLLIMIVSHAFRVRFIFMVVFNIFTIILYLVSTLLPYYAKLDDKSPDIDNWSCIVFVLLCSFSSVLCAYNRELLFRSDFMVRKSLLLENITSRGMLRNMFPKKEHSDLLLKKQVPLEVLENAVLLYSDIKGFTSMVSNMEPYILCTYLDALYSKFDGNLDKYGIYKLDTIGDAFVAIIGVTDDDDKFSESASVRMTKFAFEMIADIEEFCETNKLELAMRIGIHKGTVVGSVAGKLKPRYLTWGKDCLIGTKIEETGEPNKVHISESVKEELEQASIENDWEITPNFVAMSTTFNSPRREYEDNEGNSESEGTQSQTQSVSVAEETNNGGSYSGDRSRSNETSMHERPSQTFDYSSMQNPLKTVSTYFITRTTPSQGDSGVFVD